MSAAHSGHQAELVSTWFTVAERRAALARAHALLRTSWRDGCVQLIVRQGLNELQAFAIHEYPGINVVRLRLTGELVARAVPGEPLHLVPELQGRCGACECTSCTACAAAPFRGAFSSAGPSTDCTK